MITVNLTVFRIHLKYLTKNHPQNKRIRLDS